MANENFKKSQAWGKKDNDRHVRYKLQIAAGDHFFIEHPPLLESAADRMAYRWYSRLAARHTEPHRIISVGPEYDRIDKKGIESTVSRNR